jgi:hypothetical protein
MDDPPDIVSLAGRLGQGCSGSEAMTHDDLPDRFGLVVTSAPKVPI